MFIFHERKKKINIFIYRQWKNSLYKGRHTIQSDQLEEGGGGGPPWPLIKKPINWEYSVQKLGGKKLSKSISGYFKTKKKKESGMDH